MKTIKLMDKDKVKEVHTIKNMPIENSNTAYEQDGDGDYVVTSAKEFRRLKEIDEAISSVKAIKRELAGILGSEIMAERYDDDESRLPTDGRETRTWLKHWEKELDIIRKDIKKAKKIGIVNRNDSEGHGNGELLRGKHYTYMVSADNSPVALPYGDMEIGTANRVRVVNEVDFEDEIEAYREGNMLPKKRGRKPDKEMKIAMNLSFPQKVHEDLTILAALARMSKSKVIFNLIEAEACRRSDKIAAYKKLFEEDE